MPASSYLRSLLVTRSDYRPAVAAGPKPVYGDQTDTLIRLLSHARDSELCTQHVARMIAQQRPPSEILNTLCEYIGSSRDDRQVIFLLLDGGEWNVAAKGDLTHRSEAAFARLDPSRLSEILLMTESACAGCREYPFEQGWARQLCSGTGELLGMMVGLSDGASLPFGLYATRIASVCSLAILAIEQANLVEELTFKADVIRKQLAIEAALKERAQAANRAKSEFLANMSHEIRTPMNGDHRHAGPRAYGEPTPKTHAGISKSRNLRRSRFWPFINDILDLSKIEAGRLKIDPVVFSPRSLAEETLRLVRRAAQAKGLKLDCDISVAVPRRSWRTRCASARS